MSEQDGTQSPTKPGRSSKTNSANQQNGKQASAAQRPANDDREAWTAYWKTQGQPWRTEPEIDEERQKFLAERRNVTPDIEQGVYPFKDIKLTRANVEWLLVTHENGQGPVDWNNEKDLHERTGLNLCGADLRRVNLDRLPLSCLRGGLTQDERDVSTREQAEMAAIHLEGASLRRTRLERAVFSWAHLENANLFRVHLERANLYGAHLEKTDLRQAHLQGIYLLRSTIGDETSTGPALLNARWGDADLAVVQWSQIKMLADEYEARQIKPSVQMIDNWAIISHDYERAVRANRQLATALQNQGLNEVASRFAYRAQLCQRIVFRRQKKFGQYLFSGFLDLLAGYGYRPGRSVLWYLAMICGFALAYHFLGGLSLYPPDAFIFSITSFHGRGFFPSLSQEANLHNPLVMLAAAEAIVGLLIEISFIATFTQRFFGK